MPTLTIVKYFNIFENILPVSKLFVSYPFILQAAKKTFNTGIIPAITFPAHTACNIIVFQ